MLERLKQVCIIILLLSLSLSSVRLYFWSDGILREVHRASVNLATASEEAAQTARVLRETARLQTQTLNDPALREETFLTVQHIHRLVKGLDLSVKILNTKTIPATNQLLSNTSEVVLVCRDGITKIKDEVIEEFLILMRDPETRKAINEILANIGDITKDVDGLVLKTDATMVEVNAWLKEILPVVKQMAADTQGTTENVKNIFGEVLGVAKKINAPQTKREKFFTNFLRVLVALSPSIVQILRR